MIIYSYGILLDLCRVFIWSAISQKLLHMQKEILWDFPFGIGKIAIQLTNKIREFNFVHTHLGHAHAKMTLSQAPSALLQPLPMVLFLLLFRSKSLMANRENPEDPPPIEALVDKYKISCPLCLAREERLGQVR